MLSEQKTTEIEIPRYKRTNGREAEIQRTRIDQSESTAIGQVPGLSAEPHGMPNTMLMVPSDIMVTHHMNDEGGSSKKPSSRLSVHSRLTGRLLICSFSILCFVAGLALSRIFIDQYPEVNETKVSARGETMKIESHLPDGTLLSKPPVKEAQGCILEHSSVSFQEGSQPHGVSQVLAQQPAPKAEEELPDLLGESHSVEMLERDAVDQLIANNYPKAREQYARLDKMADSAVYKEMIKFLDRRIGEKDRE